MPIVRNASLQRLRRSQAQERALARKLHGRRVAGSGNQSEKGDVKTAQWLVEAKMSQTPRYSITLQIWRKIVIEAIRAHKRPALLIELAGVTLAVIDFNDFLELKELLENETRVT